MKRLLAICTGLLICCTIHAQDKWALIVAVGTYPAGSGVPAIASVNDVKYIKAALLKNGFPAKNIDSLINARATKTGILKSLDAMAAKAKKNDIVVLHFACHGQQIRDQRTVELGKDEDDGYDEALLPYDARGKYNPTGYKGENHLRDDDLYPKLKTIRERVGPGGSLLVLIDACHSGTGTRTTSYGISRGQPVPFPDPENPFDPLVVIPESDRINGFLEPGQDSVSNMVVISGSGPHQENKQLVVNHEELGSLSYAFYKAINEMLPNSTYAVLFEKIKATIRSAIPDQLPMIEGNTSQVIFSGQYRPVQERDYIRVGLKSNAAQTEDSIFTIDKGMMDYLAVGMKGKIYAAGTGEPLATAVIRKTEHFSSIGVAGIKLKRAESYELRMDEEGFGNFSAALSLPSVKTGVVSGLEKQVQQLVKPYKFISLKGPADYFMDVLDERDGRKVVMMDRNNRQLWSNMLERNDSLSAEDQQALLHELKKAIRVKYLRMMPDGGSLAGVVNIRIVPEKTDSVTGEPVLAPGDDYTLHIENTGNQQLFYTVLDILPDNTVEILYPFRDKEPANYSVDRKNKVIRKLGVSRDALAGREMLKVIVSKEPMDLRSVFERKKERNDNNSFQQVMDDLFKDGKDQRSVRTDVSNISVEEVGIITTAFTVKK